jgi:hypothetical protein
MDDETWVRETLTRAAWPLDEEALPITVLVLAGIRRQLDAVAADPAVRAALPEVDLDPARAPGA